MKENKFDPESVFRINETVVENNEQNGSSSFDVHSRVEARSLRKKNAFDFYSHSVPCCYVYSHDSLDSNNQGSTVGSNKACAIYNKCDPYIYFECLLYTFVTFLLLGTWVLYNPKKYIVIVHILEIVEYE